MDLQEKAERIRWQRRQLGHVCGSNPCPEELKWAALEYVEARTAQGAAEGTAAAEIGVAALTLARWRQERPSAVPRFVPVVVDEQTSSGSRFIVHGPGGLRIEGLDLDSLAELLRRLA